MRKIPQNQAEKTPTFKGDSFRNPFTKDNQNNRQTLKTTQNNVAAPRASNSSNQEKLIDEKSFFLDSMELKSLPQSDNFAGLPGSSVIQQQTMNHTPSNQVTHQNRKDDRGPFNISPSDNNSRNIIKLITKEPKYQPKQDCYILNFKGKSRFGSIKNMILIEPLKPKDYILMFCKNDSNEFHL